MSDKRTSGRTPWDALIEVLSSWRLFALISVTLLIVVLFIHFSAEPGTQVQIFGVISYQKAKAPITPPPPDIGKSVSGYLLPKDAKLSTKPVPILDGTLALKSEIEFYGNGQLIGVNIGKVKIGARNLDGTAARIYQIDKSAVIFWWEIRMELEYRGNYFAITVRESTDRDDGLVLRVLLASVDQIPVPSLDLVNVVDLPLRPGH